MRLASHNSMTFLPVAQWWLKPFGWFAKCQSKTLIEQHNAGCRIFDIRLKPYNFRKDKKGNTECEFAFGHGLVRYDFGNKFTSVYQWLNSINKHAFNVPDKTFVRVLLEYNKRDAEVEDCFREYCSSLSDTLVNLVFCGGQTKADWTVIYDFGEQLPNNIIEAYASMPSNPKIYGAFPMLYAKLNNSKSIETQAHTHNYLMLDFI